MFTAETTQQPSPVYSREVTSPVMMSMEWHPARKPPDTPLAQPYSGCPAEDIKNKHKQYLDLPKMTVLITDFAEMSLE